MSTLSTPIPFPVQAKSSPLDALRRTAAKSKSGHLLYDGDFAQEQAERYLQLSRQADEIDREVKLCRDAILDAVTPWHQDQITRKGKYTPTVVVDTPAGELKCTFQHRYAKIPATRADDLRQVVNGDFDRLFTTARSIKVKGAVTEDQGAYESLISVLREALGNELFEHCFETEETLQPTKAYTEQQYALPAEQRTLLALAGVKQVVALSGAKGGKE